MKFRFNLSKLSQFKINGALNYSNVKLSYFILDFSNVFWKIIYKRGI